MQKKEKRSHEFLIKKSFHFRQPIQSRNYKTILKKII
jgi:hypothetical protein